MKSLQRSFAGGEITPELFARLDLTKFQTGVELCRNFEVRPHGPLVNRAGFSYILATKDSSKRSVVLPFIYNANQAYILEFGDLYVRFHTLGGTVLETGLTITGITQALTGVLTYTGTDPTSGDWLYLSGISGMTELNGRYVKAVNVNAGANTFEIHDIHGSGGINTTGFGAWTANGTAARVYEIASPYAVADLEELEFTQSSDVLTISHVGYQTRELRRLGATNWQFSVVTVAPTQAAPTAVVVTPNAAGGVTYEYTVTALATDGREESLKATPGSNAACQDLTTAGAFNTVTWTNASGAVRYNVYRKFNGLYGYIGQAASGVGGFKDDNITPDISQTPPEVDDPISSASNYPGAVGHHGGRRWFAGSTNKPQNVWATRSGTEANMAYSIPTRDSDAITARLTARRADRILHLVSLRELLALTSGAEWLIHAGGGVPLTPANIGYTPQGYTGSSYVRPVITDSSVIYAADRGGHVREIAFSWETGETGGYKIRDLSLMAPHLFDGYTIVSMAFSRGPHPTLWCVRSDGKLLALTYVPEHKVEGWHQHDTLGGAFESVAVIPEGDDDVLYAVVNRTIGGTTRRYVERKESRAFATLADSFVVDSGLRYSGASTTTISGLWHLIGETVSILSNGAVEPQKVVSADGKVTLDAATTKAVVGKQITAQIKTLPITTEAREAFGQGWMKDINYAYVRAQYTSGLFIGPNFSELREAEQRTNEPYGTPPTLMTGIVQIMVDPAWSEDAPACIEQSQPLPTTILGLVLDTAYGG